MVQVDTTFTAEERQYLVRVLEARLGETRVEVHRTHSPGFREEVLQEEELIRALLAKFR